MNAQRVVALLVLVGAIVIWVTLAAHAAPLDKTLDIIAQSDHTFAPKEFTVQPGENVNVIFTNGDYFGSHDLVFELDGGRVVRSDLIGPFAEQSLTFAAPATAGDYVYYCSVHRADGMEGKMHVGTGGTVTPAPTATHPPSDVPYETVIGDLNNPHGLALVGTGDQGASLLIAEGGTGPAGSGAFQPGNGDGEVLSVPLDDPELRDVVVEGLTNVVDPSGGVVGANHAIWLEVKYSATDTAVVDLVAVAGRSGHARPEEAAKVLAIGEDDTRRVIADPLAYEQAHNPGGEDPAQGGIDSNPWRLVPHGDYVYIVDAGANDILKLDPKNGDLSTYAVLAPVNDPRTIQAVPSGMAWDPVQDNRAYVSLLGGFRAGEGQIRSLVDENGDGDALDPGENTLVADGLNRPTDLAFAPSGLLYTLEVGPNRVSLVSLGGDALGPSRLGGLVSGQAAQSSTQPVAAIVPRADKLYGASGMAFEPSGDLLVSVYGWPGAQGAPQVNTDRVVRVPAARLAPPGTPTPTGGTPGPTPTGATPIPSVTTPAPTPTTTETTPPGGADIYLPVGLRKGNFG